MNQVKRCRYGDILYQSNDIYVGRSFDLYGEFSEGEVVLFRQLIKPGQVVLDIGANIGAHTIPLAQLAGPTGRVLAFEPQRMPFYSLCANVALNNLGNVICHQAAVGEAAGTLAVPELDFLAEHNFGGLTLAHDYSHSRTYTVPVLKIDDLGLDNCHFMKIDVEGMERIVLAGAVETIRRFRPILYVEDDRKDRSAALREFLESLGFELYVHRPPLFNPGNFFKNPQNVFGRIISQNLYCHFRDVRSPVNPADFQMVKVRQEAALGQQVPDDSVRCYQQGIQLAMEGKLDSAIAKLEQALRLNPDYAVAHSDLGNVYYTQRRYDAAVPCYERAVRLRPEFPVAYNNLGAALTCLGRFEEAATRCRSALSLKPDYPEAHNNLGNALKELGQIEEAIFQYQEAVRLKPDYAAAHNNLGSAFQTLGRLEKAVACYREALRLLPNYTEAYHGLGSALGNQGRLEEAVACYRQALRLWPDYPDAHFNLGLTLLLQGQLEQGWAEYEWRRHCKGYSERAFREPLWDATPLGGQPILLYAEYGVGDTLQFVRYARMVKQHGGQVILECQSALSPLLASCPGIDRLVVKGAPLPEFAVQASLLSLPGILRTTLSNIPAATPYLYPEAPRQARWQQELKGTAAFTVGIAWQGNPRYGQDRLRSVPLTQFAPLAAVPGVRLVRLQRGPGSEQLAQLDASWTVFDPPDWPEDPGESWLETAALMSALNLVVTVDTAVAHLAGALAVPAWVALPFVPDWRWLLEREDSPWYPSMRLFRQSEAGKWDVVFDRIAGALTKHVANNGP